MEVTPGAVTLVSPAKLSNVSSAIVVTVLGRMIEQILAFAAVEMPERLGKVLLANVQPEKSRLTYLPLSLMPDKRFSISPAFVTLSPEIDKDRALSGAVPLLSVSLAAWAIMASLMALAVVRSAMFAGAVSSGSAGQPVKMSAKISARVLPAIRQKNFAVCCLLFATSVVAERDAVFVRLLCH